MRTFFSAIQFLNTAILQIAAVLKGKLISQPVKLPAATGMIPYLKH
jgi:hypothetical protein